MATTTNWHGTSEEGQALDLALRNWCSSQGEGEHCQFGPMGMRVSTCAAHEMLSTDQRALDGLLFMRRQAERLLEEESKG